MQTANDGRMALHAFRSFQPDLVVLDIMLPELDGLEVLAADTANVGCVCDYADSQS